MHYNKARQQGRFTAALLEALGGCATDEQE